MNSIALPGEPRVTSVLRRRALFACIAALMACKSAGAPTPESAPHPVDVAAAPPYDPGVQACAQHFPPTPAPGYPTFTTSCQMPSLPAGYPMSRPAADRPWLQGDAAVGPLNVKDPKNIAKLLAALKAYVAPVFNPYILDPTNASARPDQHGWRMMPWLGDADCDVDWSGRDSSVGTSTGQLIPAGTLPGQKSAAENGDLQNHSITWYDPWGAYALSSVFGAPTPGTADPTKQQMADGTVIVKMAVLTPYADGSQWPTVADAPIWPVFRPPVGENTDYCKAPMAKSELLQTRLLQFDIILKSSYYAPETEWLFATWIYDPNAKGADPLDRFTALGAMWGNDPGIAQTDLCTPVSPLQQNWINPGTPAYGYEQLGWGCRLSGPIDVGRRPVQFENGSSCATARVSACLSCHGSSEFPLKAEPAATLYPLAKSSYSPFLVADPGSAQWGNWFQSRAPTDPQGDQNGQNKGSFIAFDYDMVFVVSVPISLAAAGDKTREARARHATGNLREARRPRPLLALAPTPGANPPLPPPGCDCSCAPLPTAKKRSAAAR